MLTACSNPQQVLGVRIFPFGLRLFLAGPLQSPRPSLQYAMYSWLRRRVSAQAQVALEHRHHACPAQLIRRSAKMEKERESIIIALRWRMGWLELPHFLGPPHESKSADMTLMTLGGGMGIVVTPTNVTFIVPIRKRVILCVEEVRFGGARRTGESVADHNVPYSQANVVRISRFCYRLFCVVKEKRKDKEKEKKPGSSPLLTTCTTVELPFNVGPEERESRMNAANHDRESHYDEGLVISYSPQSSHRRCYVCDGRLA
ncbi:hypothetical protein HOY80DRAFT_997682 [Tuber brumale]|nr:hypothetical protein HOY80DRAFT_997682 [Tuber brumale]